jgi:RNA polymerase sigma factor (TIGR02999 family)
MQQGILTGLLKRAADGDADAAGEVWSLVYRDIRAMAASAIAGEARRGEFEPTLVVNEVYLRIAAQPARKWESRRHFFGAVARAMEQFLIDTARNFSRKKRTAMFVDASVAELTATLENEPQRTGEDAIKLIQQVARLEKESSGAAEVVRLRYVFGLTNQQVAAALGISESEVANLVRFGRAFISDAMRRDEE